MVDGRHVTHHQNFDLKKIEHYIDNISNIMHLICKIKQYISTKKQKIQLLNDLFLTPQGDIQR